MADFEWFRSFCSIYKHNSVSEAAKTRMLTQPAMSQHLASLEEATMNFRAASLPTLTMIKIGTAHEFYTEKILPRLHRYDFRTITHFGTAAELLEMLKEDKVDIIITSQKVQTPGIEYLKLMDEEFEIVAPQDYEIPDTDDLEVREQWLSEQPWLSYGLELPIIRRIWREHFKKRPQIRPIHIIPNLHMILKAIGNGTGLSVITTYLKDEASRAHTKVIYEDLKVQNELFFAFKLKHKHLPQIREIMAVIHEEG